jgi:hypothetical protein
VFLTHAERVIESTHVANSEQTTLALFNKLWKSSRSPFANVHRLSRLAMVHSRLAFQAAPSRFENQKCCPVEPASAHGIASMPALTEEKAMRLTIATLIVLVALAMSTLGATNTHAGSITLSGQGGDGLTFVDYSSVTTYTPIPAPTSIAVSIFDYDPSQFFSGGTTGHTTTYSVPAGTVSILIVGSGSPLWPDWFGLVTSMTITAPQPGGGLDSIELDGANLYDGTGGVIIYAPNGTLSTSSAPATLDAFQNFGMDHFGSAGFFYFGIGFLPGNEAYLGQAFGVLGVPEPSTFVAMSIGLPFVLGVVGFTRSKRRNARALARQSLDRS